MQMCVCVCVCVRVCWHQPKTSYIRNCHFVAGSGEFADYNSSNITATFGISNEQRDDVATPIPITNDDIDEVDEVFVVVLELVDAVNPDRVDILVRPASLCRIVDEDSKTLLSLSKTWLHLRTYTLVHIHYNRSSSMQLQQSQWLRKYLSIMYVRVHVHVFAQKSCPGFAPSFWRCTLDYFMYMYV